MTAERKKGAGGYLSFLFKQAGDTNPCFGDDIVAVVTKDSFDLSLISANSDAD